MPRVSIVLPVYNGEKYLKESIDSIIVQTYKDWELIIVNDCSTDNTISIAEKYAAIDERIKIINNKVNMRLPRSLNIGFADAVGEYLTWTSDDNIYLPTALAEMVAFLDSYPGCFLVTAEMDIIDKDGNTLRQADSFDEASIFISNSVGACFMYRHCVIDIIGEYDTDRFLVEDYDYWLRIHTQCGAIKLLPKLLYKYRVHDGSLTATRCDKVRYQKSRLYVMYQEQLLAQCKTKKMLSAVYYDLLLSGVQDAKLIQQIKEILKEVENESFDFKQEKPFVIFGAGEYGQHAAQMLGKKAIAFVDNNDELVGLQRCCLPIISAKELHNRIGEVNICISLGATRIWEVIQQIHDMGVKQYWTYQGLVNISKNKIGFEYEL